MAAGMQQPAKGAPPPHTSKDLVERNGELFQHVSAWLKKHGKLVKPKLSSAQKEELNVVFGLMDEDGSGAIDSEEMQSAFKLLGFNFTKAQIRELIAEVAEEGRDEVNYNEFLEVMTVSLIKMAGNQTARTNQVPVSLITTAYTRKKLLEHVLEGTAEGFGAVLHAGEEQEKAKERERAAAEERARQAEIDSSMPSEAMRKVSQVSQLSVGMLKGTLSGKEIQALASMSSKLGDAGGRSPRRASQVSASPDETPWLTSPRTSISSRGSGSLPQISHDVCMHARGDEASCSSSSGAPGSTQRGRTRLCLATLQDESGRAWSPRSQPITPAGSHCGDSPGACCSSKGVTTPKALQPLGTESGRQGSQRGMTQGFMSPRASRHWELEPIATRVSLPTPVVPPMLSSSHHGNPLAPSLVKISSDSLPGSPRSGKALGIYACGDALNSPRSGKGLGSSSMSPRPPPVPALNMAALTDVAWPPGRSARASN